MEGIGKRVPLVGNLSSPATRLFVRTGAGACICALLLAFDPHVPGLMSSFFFYLLYTYDRPVAEASVLLILLATAIAPFCGRVSAAAAACGRHPWRVAAVTGAVLALAARYVYHAHPLSMDEYTAWFQSRIFASGALSAHFPPSWLDRLIYQPFQNYFLVVSRAGGDVTSAYWPGFALAMAPFSLIGAEWLCNPVLSALTIVAIARTCRLLFPENEAVAGWAILFTVASPAFAGSGISYFAMTGLLLANLVFVWGFLQPTARRLFISGIVGSLALTFHNPLPHTLFALPWLIWFLGRRPPLRHAAALIAGYAPLTLLLGLGWVLFKAHVAADGAGQLAHAPSQGFLALVASVFSLPSASIFVIRAAGAIKLWVWAVPGLLILACMGYARWRENRAVQLLAASALLTFFAYFFVPFDQGNGWGYRYFHPAWGVLPILAGAAVAGGLRNDDGEALPAFRNLAGAFIVCSLLILVPWQLRNIETHISTQLARIPDAPANRRSIVFVFVDRNVFLNDLVQNDPLLRNRSIRMVGKGEQADGEFLRSAHIAATPLPATEFGQVWLIGQ
ncbi:hypothetical protein WT07_20550 [Burkholderia stagnalis]|nr:hypothetical protein WT07_20550 [Burkholderia stagnalis]KWE08685.1 hypothetical protein WT47_13645 [Burkholderia stagnalis]KWE16186.1 hypothetical protein WT48_15875 [Burkholderia stagnalis]KWO79406.1 hypothetical protein WU00_07915 [Burkholderia stagnalis]